MNVELCKGWILRMNEPQPELIILESPHIRILSIVDYFVTERGYAEHYSRVGQTAVEQHVELN